MRSVQKLYRTMLISMLKIRIMSTRRKSRYYACTDTWVQPMYLHSSCDILFRPRYNSLLNILSNTLLRLYPLQSDIAEFKFIDAPFEFRFTQGSKRNSTTASPKKTRKYSWLQGVEGSVGDVITYSGLAEAIKVF
jgi:hypothetical protein